MPYALGALQVQGGKTYTVSVGTAATVGAVVIANESPYSVNASAGSGGQWIVAQTTDILACDTNAFNGNITLTTDNYLSNASNAPSFLVYFTAYAPGEAIRGTYPAPLMRLSNGGGIVTQLVNDGSSVGMSIIESTPAGAAQSYVLMTNDGTLNLFYKSPSLGVVQALIVGLTPDAQYGVGVQISNGLMVFHPTALDANAAQPIRTDGNGNISFVGNINSTGTLTAAAPVTLAAAHQETGKFSLEFSAAGAGSVMGLAINFKTVMTNIPSNITFSVQSSTNIASGPTVTWIDRYGAHIKVTSTAAGDTYWIGTYTTVGN